MNLSIRIGGALLLPVAMLVGLSGYHLARIQDLVESNRTMAGVGYETDARAASLVADLAEVREFVAKSRILPDPEYAGALARAETQVRRDLDRLDQLELAEPARLAVARLTVAWREYLDARAEGPAPRVDAALAEVGSRVAELQAASRRAAERIVSTGAEEADRAWSVARIVAAGALVVVGLLAVVLVRSVVGPVRRVMAGSRRIAEGDFDVRIDPDGPPELVELARDFNRMAERLAELEDLKEELMTNVSHELKAPLASIQEASRVLVEGVPGPLNERQDRLVRHSLESGERLSKMISDLLDLTRLRGGAVAYEAERHDAADLVHASLSELSSLIEGRNLTVETDLPSEPVEVTWDGSLVLQVLRNLLSNAIRFTSEGGKIGIALTRAPGADEIEIRVRDMGPGIPDEDKERIFERFYRVDRRRRGSQGTGLGLAIARTIVEGHGGRIRVEDSASGGSEFVVRLPEVADVERGEVA